MIHDQIQLAIKEVQKLQDALKGAKKDIKEHEKIDDDAYFELKAAAKDLKSQVKDFEEQYLGDLESDEFYGELRKAKLQAEEDLALAREKLFNLMAKVPFKPFEIDASEGEDFVKIQAMPEMRVYVNGKEIKK